MNIGAAAKASGVSAKMIRYYEEQGLMVDVKRTDAGYRIYSEQDVQVLCFIKRARDLGFAVEWIKSLLALWQDQHRRSSDVRELAKRHVDELQHKIGQLQQMVGTLQTLIDCCAGDSRPDCPILADLEQVNAAMNPDKPCCH